MYDIRHLIHDADLTRVRVDFMVGLQSSGFHFLIYLCTCFMNGFVALSLFAFAGAIATDLRMAQTIAPITVVLFSLFGYAR